MPGGRDSASRAAAHAVRAWCCPLLHLQIREFSGEAPIVAVLRLKILNLLLALLPVHSAFLSIDGIRSSNKHCAPKSESAWEAHDGAAAYARQGAAPRGQHRRPPSFIGKNSRYLVPL